MSANNDQRIVRKSGKITGKSIAMARAVQAHAEKVGEPIDVLVVRPTGSYVVRVTPPRQAEYEVVKPKELSP